MMARTEKQNVDEPAANPSRPSVRFTAFDVPTITSTAKTIQPALPSCQPGSVARVTERVVAVWTQKTASTAKMVPNKSCKSDFARLFRPRLRRFLTLVMSSRKPMSPKPATAKHTSAPALVNPTWVPMWPSRNPTIIAPTITMPPIVGVPALTECDSGPSSRMC